LVPGEVRVSLPSFGPLPTAVALPMETASSPPSEPLNPRAGGATSSWAPLDEALRAYRSGDTQATLVMRTDVAGSEDVPVSLFFREPAALGAVESAALRLAWGRVLDLGAGPGALAGPLVRSGLDVTAVEILPQALAALRERGVPDVREGGLEVLGPEERFDTVLVLMNGLGLAGTLEGLGPFLARLAAATTEGAQILADSTDPSGWDDPGDGRYPGEVHMQLAFAGRWGEPFPFLFVDAERVRAAAAARGLEVTVAADDADGRWLARITASVPLTPARPAGCGRASSRRRGGRA